MNTTEIKWTNAKTWGTVGLTHYAEIVIGEDRINFTVDQPSKGQWIARGWRNGDFFFYRDEPSGRTLAGAKASVERQIGELLIAAAEKPADPAEASEILTEVSGNTDEPSDCTCVHQPEEDAGVLLHASYCATEADERIEPGPSGWDQGLSLVPAAIVQFTGPAEEAEPECWCETEHRSDGTELVHVIGGCPDHDPYQDEDVCTLCGHVDCLPTCTEYTRPVVDLSLPEATDEDEPECWCEWVDIGVGMQRVAEIAGCPQHHPDPLADLTEDIPGRPVVDLSLPESLERFNAWAGDVNRAMSGLGRHIADSMNTMTRMFRSVFYRPPCGCPTPTHRMSCGVGAVPRVVSS